MDLNTRAFGRQDIEFAVAQTSREGWDNTDSTFRVCLSHDPEGCFIAEIDGQRAGIITTTRYVRSAWVGNLIVAPDFRRRGIGQQLMEHAMGQLEAIGIRTFWLEADPMGVSIYKRLGFVPQFESPRFQKKPPHTAGRGGTEPMLASDLGAVRTIDAFCFGDDRGNLLGKLRDIARAAYCARVNGRVVGFAMALPSAAGVRLGPCVADDSFAAGKLIDSILGDFPDQTIVVAVPGVNESATRLLESREFARGLPSLRMRRGKADTASAPDRIVALANGAMG